MKVQARAKVNLTLEVLGRRPDGFHEIRSVMRSLALHDEIDIEHAPVVEVLCDIVGLGGSENLAYAAAMLLQKASKTSKGARITIRKNVPVAAGLGGGSSDAAATLMALNTLWHAGLDHKALSGVAARLGSDVPFFLAGGTALASGRGEILQPLAAQPDCHVVLVNPGLAASTAAIYSGVTASMYAGGSSSARFAALAPGTAPREWPLANTLQLVTSALYPEINEILEALASWGAVRVQMCGSGPTCFGLFEDRSRAQHAVFEATARHWRAWLTHFA
jgi:4-diphosphocytidyl-2-C-methyl-D-erythritol kinase